MNVTTALTQRLDEKRSELVERYFAALRRFDPTDPKSIDQIDELARAMGRGPREADEDRANLLKLEAADGVESRIEKLSGDVNAANAEYGRFEAWRDAERERLDAAIESRRLKVQEVLNAAAARLSEAKQVKRDAAVARRALENLRGSAAEKATS